MKQTDFSPLAFSDQIAPSSWEKVTFFVAQRFYCKVSMTVGQRQLKKKLKITKRHLFLNYFQIHKAFGHMRPWSLCFTTFHNYTNIEKMKKKRRKLLMWSAWKVLSLPPVLLPRTIMKWTHFLSWMCPGWWYERLLTFFLSSSLYFCLIFLF